MSGPSNRDIVGFPIVPPARVTRAVLALRRGIMVLQRRSAPPQVRLLEALFGLFDNRVLGLLVDAGIPDLLDRPRRLEDLAVATGLDADALERVLRYGAGRGFLAVDRRGRYRPNDLTDVLRHDHPSPWRGWVEFLGSDWQWNAWRHADACLHRGVSGIEAATGYPFFQFVNQVKPEAGEAFNAAMAAGATLQALVLSHSLDWSGVEVVCDVGGGTGSALEYLLASRPELRGVLLDLPEVVEQARPRLRHGDLAGRCQLVGGSFFDELPAGHDRYLLLAIIHDWSDNEATAILGRVGEAIGPHGRAIVVENVLSNRPKGDMADATHLLMRVLASGRERTQPQFEALFHRAGLAIEQRRPLASGFTAFVLRRP